MKKIKILYFVDGFAPTLEQMIEAEAVPFATVCFRNARSIGCDDSLESCDGVMGHIPLLYSNSPKLVDVLANRDKENKAVNKKVSKTIGRKPKADKIEVVSAKIEAPDKNDNLHGDVATAAGWNPNN